VTGEPRVLRLGPAGWTQVGTPTGVESLATLSDGGILALADVKARWPTRAALYGASPPLGPGACTDVLDRDIDLREAGSRQSCDRGKAMPGTPERRILVVANRTAATPEVLAAVKRYAREQPTTFALLIPDARKSKNTDWTLEQALPILERAAGRPVDGLTGTSGDPFDAIQTTVANGQYDRIVLSTLPKTASRWLRQGLPRRVESLGLPVEVITVGRESMTNVMEEATRTGFHPG